MGELGLGYGSAFHLLRFLGRHRNELNSSILKSIELEGEIEWMDFIYDKAKKIPDKEFIGIDFFENLNNYNYNEIKAKWEQFWPSKKQAQNWDAIGRINNVWLLVEAKAHAGEMTSNTGAGDKSKKVINDKIDEAKKYFGINESGDWLSEYYQKANRILFLYFLKTIGIEARLIYIYFLNGYEKNFSSKSIKKEEEWKVFINKQDQYLGIQDCNSLKKNIANIFIDVAK